MNKQHLAGLRNLGFTLIELLVVIAAVAILLAMLFPVDHGSAKTKAKLYACQYNLRQIGIGFFLYESDHKGQYPTENLLNAQGVDVTTSLAGVAFFKRISATVTDPKSFWCPLDWRRNAATSAASLTASNLSYFVNVDTSPTNKAPESILAGDRFLQINGKATQSGLLVLTTNLEVMWRPTDHHARGNLVFADGHVQMSRSNITPIILSQPFSTNHLIVP